MICNDEYMMTEMILMLFMPLMCVIRNVKVVNVDLLKMLAYGYYLNDVITAMLLFTFV